MTTTLTKREISSMFAAAREARLFAGEAAAKAAHAAQDNDLERFNAEMQNVARLALKAGGLQRDAVAAQAAQA